MYLLCQNHAADTGAGPVNGSGINLHPFLNLFIIENGIIPVLPGKRTLPAGLILITQNLITDLPALQFGKSLLQRIIAADDPVITVYNIYFAFIINR